MEYIELLGLKNELELLAHGIDPKSHEHVGEDSILSSKYNQRLLQSTISVLDVLIKIRCDPDNRDRRRKYNFYIDDSKKARIPISNDAISISKLAYYINAEIDTSCMKKLKASTITDWLCRNKYLVKKENDNGSLSKITAFKGTEIGIKTVTKLNRAGQSYKVNLYSEAAQKFIIEHLDEIVADENPTFW